MLDGSLRIDRYASQTGDKALYGGHVYSDKAPGISLLAVPTLGTMRLAGARDSPWRSDALLWIARLLTGGIAYLAAILLVRVGAERLHPATGDRVAVAFGLGTLALPLAGTTVGHLSAAALVFAAFLLVSARSRPSNSVLLGAGAFAGASVLFEYQAALAVAVLLAYLIVRSRSASAAVLFVAGALPAAVALGAYDWAAFGSPFHVSYRYVTEQFIKQQRSGFFGIHAPRLHGLQQLVVGRHGVLLEQPILVLAAAGLVLLWRRGLRAEALACAAVTLLFALLSAGYFDPYGGESPGPRFLVPALPFLALGLADAFARWPRLTALVTVYSAAAMLLDAGLWGPNPDFQTVWSQLGAPRTVGLGLAVVPALAALTLALRPALHRPAEATPPPPTRQSPGP
ncbi:MAG: hypothetical protein QOD08_381 [Gaiellaceae bacterium]|nr:hypothetical protein [Gaiellaceae bacterium]